VHWILLLFWLNALSFAMAFGAALLLLQITARKWRRTVEVHWSERARLAYTPGITVLWLVVGLPVTTGLVGDVALGTLAPQLPGGSVAMITNWLAAFAGIMVVRYIWLRELWGARVTLRSWLAGCLVILFVVVPSLVVTALLIFVLPMQFNMRATGMFCAAVVVVIFFLRGGGILILRALGIVKPAPQALAEMVQHLAAQMNVRGSVKVFVLEWAQVNAVAWQVYRAIGFSRALIEVMDEQEVRAVAAHELAHLLEPAWVRRIKIAHMFAYLPIVLLMKYGGLLAIPIGGFLFFAVMLGYIRFTHRYEKRADHLENKAIGDPNAYMRSMIKLHQANVHPAVMPGKQTHPHLYDRLLAAGIQPDFPRPLPPSRNLPLLTVLATTIAVAILMFAAVIATGVVFRLARITVSGVKQNPTAQSAR
jgi:Zn-dependent protease with chaperone function